MRVVVVGDSTWDVEVRGATRPRAGFDAPARITAGPGGQGANVAVRLARQGVQVSLVTALGTDEPGRQLGAALAGEGVSVITPPVERTGIVVVLVDPGGERAMLSDRSSIEAPALTSDAVLEALSEADWIHLSGYPLVDAVSGNALAEVVRSRPVTTRCSVGGGSFVPGLAVGERLRTARPDLVVFDREEAVVALSGAASPAPGQLGELTRAVSAQFQAVAVVTDGPHPAWAAMTDGSLATVSDRAPGGRAPAIDSTGAGDALAAGIIGTLVEAAWPPSKRTLEQALAYGVRLGTQVAGVVGAQARVASEGPP